MNLRLFLLAPALLACFLAHGQIERLALSPLQKIEQKIATTDISIVYSRPAMRERKIFGGLVPFDQMWRTGANRNTTIEFSKDVIIANQEVAIGKYALFSKPGQTEWSFYLYNDTSNWDVPEDMDQEKIVASFKAVPSQVLETVQSLSFSIDNITNNNFDVSLSWENTKVSFPIELTTEKQMMASIDEVLAGPDRGDFYLAAHYRLESGENLDQALEWINKSVALSEEPTWWVFSEKALIEAALNDKTAAKSSAEKALKIAQEKESEYGINSMTKFLQELK